MAGTRRFNFPDCQFNVDNAWWKIQSEKMPNVPVVRHGTVGVLSFVRLANVLDGRHDLGFDFTRTMASTWALECCCMILALFTAASRKVRRFWCIFDLVASSKWHV